MYKRIIYKSIVVVFAALVYTGCKTPALAEKNANVTVPASYSNLQDTVNVATVKWKDYFNDPNLDTLIDIALQNNQELNITLHEIQISKNEIRARKGEYLPSVGLKAEGGVEKVGRYTSQGANDANTDIKPGVEFPEPLPDFIIGAFASWEVDVWGKLRNAKKAAVMRYLSSVEGKNFMVTNLIAEIANSYYELLALDNQLEILNNNIEIQNRALEIVRLQKESARVTELAVRRFEAEVYKAKSLQFAIQQDIVETENRINFLVGRFPQHIYREHKFFNNMDTSVMQVGIPAQLLANRPDIKQAELDLKAAKLDVKAARARFYPSFGISAGIGYQAFDAKYLISPESLLYSMAGELTAPLINRNAIKAAYYSANTKQIQAVYNYERTILNAYVEVVNQISKANNLEKSYNLKAKQVEALSQSINISSDLFSSARADYMEVLLTQRDALESKFELVETKKQQIMAFVNIYRALGGGWR